jgi:hypothetical protein
VLYESVAIINKRERRSKEKRKKRRKNNCACKDVVMHGFFFFFFLVFAKIEFSKKKGGKFEDNTKVTHKVLYTTVISSPSLIPFLSASNVKTSFPNCQKPMTEEM